MLKKTYLLLIAILLLVLGGAFTVQIQAATFTVNSTLDTNDAAPGNGVCADASGNCTLRAAIQEANGLAGDDIINFNLPVPSTILLTTAELSIASSVSVNGPGANVLTISGNNARRVFNINSHNRTVTISGLTIANGRAPNIGGGGIYNTAFSNSSGIVNIVNSIISGSSTASNTGGGGIYNSGSGTMNITNSTVSGNFTLSNSFHGGGGIDNSSTMNITNSAISDNSASEGGGIFNSNLGTLTVTGSTVSGNSASGTTNNQFSGGGIYNNGGTITVTNSTVSGNSATDLGGGIAVNQGTVNITGGTVSNNSANTGGGVFNFFGGGTANVKNTIIGGNTAASESGHDVRNTFVSQGYNLIGKSDGSTGFVNGANNDQVGTNDAPVNPMLGTLANNGGPTQTHALLSGSPAIDKGNSFGSTTDQRGFTRPVDTAVGNAPGGNGADIGAFELQLSATAALVTIGGQVKTSSGRGIRNVRLTLTDAAGETHTVFSNAFGYYRFADIAAGATYIVNATSKQYVFDNPTQALFVSEETSEINFTAMP